VRRFDLTILKIFNTRHVGKRIMSIEKIDHDLCIGCGICVSSCSVDVIRMDEEAQKAVIQYPEDCMLCEFCVLDCPVEAITLSPEKNANLIVSWG
jgi:NAD-dependent dihydropyrimidine dehydrogenase PreA subunit